MAEPNNTRGQLPAWTNSGWGRFLLSALDTQIPGNAFNSNWGNEQAPTHNFTNFREFTGLGGLQRGLSGFGNFLSNAGMYASNFAPGNLFDGNQHTGLFSGRNASPELWGPPNPYTGQPSAQPVGQPNTPTGTEGPPSPYTGSPGDPRQWGPPAPMGGSQGPSNPFAGQGGRGAVASGQGWRGYGGTGGPLGGGRESQAAMDDPFGFFSSALR